MYLRIHFTHQIQESRFFRRQLNLEAKLDDYWDENIGIKMSWTIYFEEYILREIKQPLVLAFSRGDRTVKKLAL
ncbi:MAG: AAA-like domain-containing protein [Microcystis sp. LE19-114.1B]|jgi:hypothetical protein|nr:AAA-like domain-containing protein [Microcystis sp. LE19-114.1B]